MRKLVAAILLFLIATTVSAFAETKVSRIAMAKKIVNHEPEQTGTEFTENVGQLYCFTEIATDRIPTKVVHIWLYNDNIMAEIPLNVKSTKWRTYSSKKISSKWAGNWKVEVYSDDGKLIGTSPFVIK